MVAAHLPAIAVRPLVASPTPVQLGPLAPSGELLCAESVTSMQQQLTSQGVDVSRWGIDRNKGIAELWTEVQRGEAELRLDSSGRVSCFVTDFMGFGFSGLVDFARGDYKFGFLFHIVPSDEPGGGQPEA